MIAEESTAWPMVTGPVEARTGFSPEMEHGMDA